MLNIFSWVRKLQKLLHSHHLCNSICFNIPHYQHWMRSLHQELAVDHHFPIHSFVLENLGLHWILSCIYRGAEGKYRERKKPSGTYTVWHQPSGTYTQSHFTLGKIGSPKKLRLVHIFYVITASLVPSKLIGQQLVQLCNCSAKGTMDKKYCSIKKWFICFYIFVALSLPL